MNLVVGIACSIAVILGFAPITGVRRDRVNRHGLARLQETVNLPLPVELDSLVVPRIRRQERWALGGAVIGTALVATLLLATGHADAPWGGWALMGAGVGGGIGSSARLLGKADGPDRSGPRAARSRAVEPADYRPRSVTVLIVGAATTAAIAATSGALSLPGRSDLEIWPLAAGACASMVVLAAALLLPRALVARGQPAGTAFELAWDDVIRAEGLRPLAIASLATSSATGVLAVEAALRAGGAETAASAAALAIGLTAAALSVTGLVVHAFVARSYVLRRLWSGESFAAVGANGEPAC